MRELVLRPRRAALREVRRPDIPLGAHERAEALPFALIIGGILVDVFIDAEAGLAWAWKEENMLISTDLMRHLAKFVEPPAQLCLIRVLGSDHEYVFRVRYGDAHLDYPFIIPLLDTSIAVEEYCNWDEVRKALTVMSAMVVPPGQRPTGPIGVPYPQVLAPMSSEQFHYWQ